MGKISKALAADFSSNRVASCTFDKLLNQLDEDDRSAIVDAIHRKTPDYIIEQSIRSAGYKISRLAIPAHRLEQCKCYGGKS